MKIEQGVHLPMTKGEDLSKFSGVVREWLEDEKVMGGAFEKHKISVDLKHGLDQKRIKTARLVLKEGYVRPESYFRFEYSEMPQAMRYYERWRYLREIGIPTAHSMRVVNNRFVVMGDMTADGSAFMWKAYSIGLSAEEYGKVKRPWTVIEEVFMRIPPKKIKKEIERVGRLAADKKIALPLDDEMDLLVHPDGTFEVMVLDLTDLNWLKDKKDVKGLINCLKRQVDCIRHDLESIKQ